MIIDSSRGLDHLSKKDEININKDIYCTADEPGQATK